MSTNAEIVMEAWSPDKAGAVLEAWNGEQPPTALDSIPLTGNAEEDSKAELNEFQRQAQESLRREKKNQDQMFDSEFWCAVYFQSREQKLAFLEAMELLLTKGDKYIDGQELAARLGIKLPTGPKINAANRITKTWDEFVL